MLLVLVLVVVAEECVDASGRDERRTASTYALCVCVCNGTASDTADKGMTITLLAHKAMASERTHRALRQHIKFLNVCGPGQLNRTEHF